jgi:cytoskeleton protein RodZ
MSSLGQELKQARERAAMTVAEIARQTKISARLLQNLEDERFDLMPEPFFVKGVLKAYVRAVGGDEARLLALYQEAHPTAAQAAHEAVAAATPARINRPALQDFRAAKGQKGKRRRGVRLQPWVLTVLIVLLLAAVVCLVLIYFQSRPKPAPVLPSASPRVPAIVKPEVPADQPAGKTDDPTAANPSAVNPPSFAAGFKLDLRFTADTWIQVTADGRIVLDGIQAAGRETSFTAAEEFVIQIGNAGGVTYILNGRPGVPFGATGNVRTDIRINRETAAGYLRQAPSPAA